MYAVICDAVFGLFKCSGSHRFFKCGHCDWLLYHCQPFCFFRRWVICDILNLYGNWGVLSLRFLTSAVAHCSKEYWHKRSWLFPINALTSPEKRPSQHLNWPNKEEICAFSRVSSFHRWCSEQEPIKSSVYLIQEWIDKSQMLVGVTGFLNQWKRVFSHWMRAHLCVPMLSYTPGLRLYSLCVRLKAPATVSSQTCSQIPLKASLHSLVLASFFFFCCSCFKCVLQCFQTAASQKLWVIHRTVLQTLLPLWNMKIWRRGESFASSWVSALMGNKWRRGETSASALKPVKTS